MRITEFLNELEREIPRHLALPDDPIGIQVLVEDVNVSDIAIAYEVNEYIIGKAAAVGASLIIAFHPLLYPSLTRITQQTRVERCVINLVSQRIALYVVHTAFDAHAKGSSFALGAALGLEDLRPLVANPDVPGAGMGAIGRLATDLRLEQLAALVQDVCSAQVVRVSNLPGQDLKKSVRNVAILAGSGMSYYEHAVAQQANAFITADIRYHSFHAANDQIPVLDPGHAETERFVAPGLAKLVRQVAGDNGPRVHLLDEPTNPVYYVTDAQGRT